MVYKCSSNEDMTSGTLYFQTFWFSNKISELTQNNSFNLALYSLFELLWCLCAPIMFSCKFAALSRVSALNLKFKSFKVGLHPEKLNFLAQTPEFLQHLEVP